KQHKHKTPVQDPTRLLLGFASRASHLSEASEGLRPRLCHMAKGANGYGFNLHSEKSKPGQFIRPWTTTPPPRGPACCRRQDPVNSMSVAGMQHAEVVATIKAGGEDTSMLVVDSEADAYFTSCNVLPTEEHLRGRSTKTAADLNPASPLRHSSSSSSSSNSSLPATTPAVTMDVRSPKPFSLYLSGGLSMSLAQVKERAHQKRMAKKAPAMDWSKRNELFSNL
uniref:EBP50 C-terminal domain-containing protein n=1 Tax=Gadus morhua TaxID=8049 RepID=A0A8C5CGV5_GADMO